MLFGRLGRTKKVRVMNTNNEVNAFTDRRREIHDNTEIGCRSSVKKR